MAGAFSLERRVVAGVALTALVLQIIGYHDLRHDDAYITYRYGQNLALGRGLVFNAGERLFGSTAPGHALLSALVYAVVGKTWTPDVMAAIGCVGWTAQAIALSALLRRALGVLGAAAVAVFVLAGGVGSGDWVALETNLVTAAVWTAFALGAYGRWFTASVVCGVACVVRPDAMLAAAILGAAWFRVGAPTPARTLLGLSLPSALWALFAWSHFGGVLPSSVTKLGRVSAIAYLQHAFEHVGGNLLSGIAPSDALGAAMGWTLAVVGTLWLGRRERFFVWIGLYALLHTLAYCAMRPFVQHTWHLYPSRALVTVLGLAVFAAALARATSWAQRVLPALVLAVACVLAVQRTTQTALGLRDAYWMGARDSAYRSAAAFLREHAREADVVASVEPGTLAYWSDLKFHDTGGLVSPGGGAIRPGLPVCWLVTYGAYARTATIMRARHVAAFSHADFTADVHRVTWLSPDCRARSRSER